MFTLLNVSTLALKRASFLQYGSVFTANVQGSKFKEKHLARHALFASVEDVLSFHDNNCCVHESKEGGDSPYAEEFVTPASQDRMNWSVTFA